MKCCKISNIFIISIFLVLFSFQLQAESIFHAKASLRNNLYPQKFYHTLKLSNGDNITFESDQNEKILVKQLSESLKNLHITASKLFGEIPELHTKVKLMKEVNFFRETKAPKWTNAIFYKGDIWIPINFDKKIDFNSLNRTIKHEFMHAIIDSLTDGKCPGWLDEGLAQWIEGKENPALLPALKSWLNNNPPVKLDLLQGGFTKLETKMVPAAYAQSLFAANGIISTFGFTNISEYFKFLNKGYNSKKAFKKSFKISEDKFETRLGKSLVEWVG